VTREAGLRLYTLRAGENIIKALKREVPKGRELLFRRKGRRKYNMEGFGRHGNAPRRSSGKV